MKHNSRFSQIVSPSNRQKRENDCKIPAIILNPRLSCKSERGLQHSGQIKNQFNFSDFCKMVNYVNINHCIHSHYDIITESNHKLILGARTKKQQLVDQLPFHQWNLAASKTHLEIFQSFTIIPY